MQGGERIEVEDSESRDPSSFYGRTPGGRDRHQMHRRATLLLTVLVDLLWLPSLVYLVQAIILTVLVASITIGMWTYLLSGLILTPLVYLTYRRIKREFMNDEVSRAKQACPCPHCKAARNRERAH